MYSCFFIYLSKYCIFRCFSHVHATTYGIKIIFILISGNPSLAIFTLFCLYALSGYVYAGWLFFMDKPNPVVPGAKAEYEKRMAEEAKA